MTSTNSNNECLKTKLSSLCTTLASMSKRLQHEQHARSCNTKPNPKARKNRSDKTTSKLHSQHKGKEKYNNMSWEVGFQDSRASSKKNNSKATVNLDDIAADIQQYARYIVRTESATKSLGTYKDSERLRAQLKSDRQKTLKLEQSIREKFNTVTNGTYESSSRAKKGHDTSIQVVGEDGMDSALKKKQVLKLIQQFEELVKRHDGVSENSVKKEKDLQSARNALFAMPGSSGSPNAKGDMLRGPREVQTGDGRLQLQVQEDAKEFVLSVADESTVNVERQIALETLNSVKSLEKDLIELHQCFTDFNKLVQEQQQGIDMIATNVKQAHQNVEIGVENIRVAKGRTGVGMIQGGVGKVFKIFSPFG